MKKLCVMALGVLLCACAPRGEEYMWTFSDQAPSTTYQQTEITVSVLPDPVMEYAVVCGNLESASRDQGVRELLHIFVGQAPIIRPVWRQDVDDQEEGQKVVAPVPAELGQCDPWLDPVTGMVRQRSNFTAALVPERRFGGVIDALQEDQTMGGMLSKAYVSLWGSPVVHEPVPVVIVQRSSGLELVPDQSLVQVVGSGMITQITDTVGQMHILESTREIFPGDMFFQLQVQTTVLPVIGDLLPLAPEE